MSLYTEAPPPQQQYDTATKPPTAPYATAPHAGTPVVARMDCGGGYTAVNAPAAPTSDGSEARCGLMNRYLSYGGKNCAFSFKGVNTVFGCCAVNSIFACVAVHGLFSLFAVNSFCSLFSANSAFSIGSVNSAFSIGCINSFGKICL